MQSKHGIGVQSMRFKKPKNGAFKYYCYMCKHYKFIRQVGAAYDGVCDIDDMIVNAYNPFCFSFKHKVTGEGVKI